MPLSRSAEAGWSGAADICSVLGFILTAIKHFNVNTAAVSVHCCFQQQSRPELHVAGEERLHQAGRRAGWRQDFGCVMFPKRVRVQILTSWHRCIDCFPPPLLQSWKGLTAAWWFCLSPFPSDWHIEWNLLFSLPDYLAQISIGSLHKARVISSN